MKILVVDDEKVLVKGIKFNLESEGYQVEAGYDGEEAVELARSGSFDLIILDLMMPKIDGLQACMRIREFSNVPIIMLTARSEDTDKIIGFECGADDYITKPFNILELKARVRALLRRAGMAAQKQGGGRLSMGHITLDVDARAAWKDGKSVDLTAKEFDLMELLLRNPGRVYSRENLLNVVWGYEYAGDYRTVDVHVRRLREKLELDPANPEYILNYLLTQNGLDPAADVTIQWLTAQEVTANMLSAEDGVCMLPVPAATALLMKDPGVRQALDLSAEWDAVSSTPLPMGCIVARREFVEEHPEAVDAFLDLYGDSISFMSDEGNRSEAAELVAKYGITANAQIAEAAIPQCNLTLLTGEEMQDTVQAYYEVLYPRRYRRQHPL